MWFIGVEVEQQWSAPPPKKILDPPLNLQYIGETKRRLKDRFNEHRRPILNHIGNYFHTAVSEHFLTRNHSDNHVLLLPFEKLKNGRDSFRKAREAHLIHKAKTIEPLRWASINVMNCNYI